MWPEQRAFQGSSRTRPTGRGKTCQAKSDRRVRKFNDGRTRSGPRSVAAFTSQDQGGARPSAARPGAGAIAGRRHEGIHHRLADRRRCSPVDDPTLRPARVVMHVDRPTTMFRLDQVVPWGRSFDEYRRMFALTDDELRLRIVGCGDGPASFNADASRRGAHVISCDPIYRYDAGQLRDRIAATYDEVLEQTRRNAEQFVWRESSSVSIHHATG